MTSAAAPRGRVETREQLLAAAAELIAQKGYERAALGDIARAAGLTTGAVYSTYGSKWELLRAVVAAQAKGLSAFPEEAADDLASSADALARQLHAVAHDEQALQVAILQLEISLLGLRDAGLRDDLVAEATARRSQLAAELRERTMRTGERLPMAAEDTAVVMTALVAGLQLLQLTEPDAVPAELYRSSLRLVLGLPASAE